jgi:hypothetical protein
MPGTLAGAFLNSTTETALIFSPFPFRDCFISLSIYTTSAHNQRTRRFKHHEQDLPPYRGLCGIVSRISCPP